MYPKHLPLRDNLRQAHAAAWHSIAGPGAFWTGAQRVAMVAEARAALSCPLCTDRKAALSPAAVRGKHDQATGLGPVAVDLIHRLRTDPGRLTKSWFDALMSAGISPQAYVEIVSVVTSSVIIDTLHQSLGLAPPPLPDAEAGQPSGHCNADAVDAGAWVPVLDAEQTLPEASALSLPRIPFILRAMGLVPSAVALFFQTFRPHYALSNIPLSISQAQAEFTAARVSALNQCFY